LALQKLYSIDKIDYLGLHSEYRDTMY